VRVDAGGRGEGVQDGAGFAPGLDPAFVGKIGHAQRAASGEAVLGREDQAQRIGKQGCVVRAAASLSPALRRVGGMEVVDDRDVGLAATDDLQCLVRFGLDDGDVDGVLGDAAGERGEGGGQQGFAGARKGDHGQRLRPVRAHHEQSLLGEA
jgi:hypothetical protein